MVVALLLRKISPVLKKICRNTGGWRYRNRSTTSDSATTLDAARQIKLNLAAAYRGCVYYGLNEGVCNHLTALVPARSGNGQVMALIPYGFHWKEVTASSLLGLDLENGEVVEGDGQAEVSASNIHRAVYRLGRPDVKCVFHVHMPYSTALAALEDPRLLMVHQNSLRFYNSIGYDGDYSDFPNAGSGQEADRIASYLGDNNVLIMGNHGVLCVGPNIAFVFDSMYYLERACMYQVLAMSTGKKVKEVSEQIVQKIYQEELTLEKIQPYCDKHFNAIKRVVSSEKPDYRL